MADRFQVAHDVVRATDGALLDLAPDVDPDRIRSAALAYAAALRSAQQVANPAPAALYEAIHELDGLAPSDVPKILESLVERLSDLSLRAREATGDLHEPRAVLLATMAGDIGIAAESTERRLAGCGLWTERRTDTKK